MKKDHDGKTDLSRRNVLLGGTTLAAASAIASTGSVQTTQAQQRPAQAQPAPSGRKPNILFIMGDDIGWFNVSAYNMGIMGTARPTSTVSEKKVRSLLTGTDNKAAPQDALPLSLDNHRYALV